MSTHRACYLVAHSIDALNVRAVCSAVFDVVDPLVHSARIDAYSDYTAQMPDDISGAELWLRDRGLRGGSADPAAAIVIDRADDVGWPIVQAYTLWSTHVALYDAAGDCLATLEDGGHAITVELTKAEAELLGMHVGSAAIVERWIASASNPSQPTG